MYDITMYDNIKWKDPVDITKEQWIQILLDQKITTEKDMQLLQLIYDSDNCRARASELARYFNMPYHAPLNSQVGRWGKRIIQELNIPPIRQKYGEGYNWWHVPFWGEGTKGGFYWILRPELKYAMDDLNMAEEFLLTPEISLPEEIDLSDQETFYEGAKKQIYVNSYERNRLARLSCLKHYGNNCVICGFDFEKTYGPTGKNIIHVHHLKPLSEIGKTYQINPIEDLRPVCPNCHLIIHRKNPPYSIDEVKTMIKKEGAN